MTVAASAKSGIALVCTALGWGGTETEAAKLACQYARRGLAATVIVTRPPLLRLSVLDEAGVPVIALGTDETWTATRYRDAVVGALRACGASLLHAHTWERDAEVFEAAKIVGIPMVITVHGTVANTWRFRLGFVRDPLGFARSRRVYARFNPVVINISEKSEADFQAIYRVTRTRRVYCGADIPTEPVDASLGADAPQALWIGSFTPRKRPLWAIDAWDRATARYPSARLVMLGDGPLMDDAKRRVESMRPGAVILVGNTPDVASHLSRSQLLLQTATREGIPMSMILADLYGMPIVACDTGAVSEAIVDGRSGHLVGVDEMDKAADRIASLVADPAQRRTMGAAARALGESRFGLERYVDETLRVYEDYCGFRRPVATI